MVSSPGDGKGYIIPDEPQPDNLRCLRVMVPDDELYLMQFWHAYQFFGTWTAWERDQGKRGRLAAAAWQAAIAETRRLYEDDVPCGGEVVELRQNPNNCAQLQSRLPNADWETWADLSGCFARNVVLPAPRPDLTYVERWEWILASWLTVIYRTYVFIVENITINRYDLYWQVINILQPIYYDIDLTQFVITLVDTIAAADDISREEKLDKTKWQPILDELMCLPGGGQGDELHWLDEWAQSIFTWLNGSTDWLFRKLNDAARWLTHDRLMRAAWAGGGGGAGFGGTPSGCSLYFNGLHPGPQAGDRGYTNIYSAIMKPNTVRFSGSLSGDWAQYTIQPRLTDHVNNWYGTFDLRVEAKTGTLSPNVGIGNWRSAPCQDSDYSALLRLNVSQSIGPQALLYSDSKTRVYRYKISPSHLFTSGWGHFTLMFRRCPATGPGTVVWDVLYSLLNVRYGAS